MSDTIFALKQKQNSIIGRSENLADALRKVSQMWEEECRQLERRLNRACDRIRDLIADGDGYAHFEARRFLDGIGEPDELPDSEEEPDDDCPYCDGVGDLPGNPNTKVFPACPHCRGTGKTGESDYE